MFEAVTSTATIMTNALMLLREKRKAGRSICDLRQAALQVSSRGILIAISDEPATIRISRAIGIIRSIGPIKDI
jgi:hypothetical protein